MAFLSACAIFLGALLLFLVQPMIGKMILPWFGGTPAVWSTCMLFFQLLLLGGYAYAAVLVRVRGTGKQVTVHVLLLAVGICLLPITPGDQWKPLDGQQPALRILIMLTACVGLPYFLLSATSPLVQSWFAKTYPNRSPYRLYALSNTGSLGALLAYPFVIEPLIATSWQGWLWSAAYGLFALLMATVLIKIRRQAPTTTIESTPTTTQHLQSKTISEATEQGSVQRPTFRSRLAWLSLSALASTMLLAVTNHLCQDVAVVPFLWIAPLALYLVSLIICFERDRWYQPGVFSLLGMMAILVASDIAYLAYMGSNADAFGNTMLTALRTSMLFLIVVYLSLFFCVCMVCHGEIARRRPSAGYLTEFYLIISAGGAMGGVIVALLCPVLFTTFAEFKIGLVICFAICELVFLRDVMQARWLVRSKADQNAPEQVPAQKRGRQPLPPQKKRQPAQQQQVRAGSSSSERLVDVLRKSRLMQLVVTTACGLLLLIVLIAQSLSTEMSLSVIHLRNFYGTLSVREWNIEEVHGRAMYHGTVLHGYQRLEEGKQNEPTTYYTRESGIGLAFASLQNTTTTGSASSLKVGAVGLGVGTIAAYGKAGDQFRFYEINPQVIELAQSPFTFLSDCPATIDIVPGDARLSLQREQPQDFDLLVLDAFSGDAIPVHLLTIQAIDIYLRHLKPGGLIAAHISNRHVDLLPVIEQLAVERDLSMAEINQAGAVYLAASPSQWLILARSPADLDRPELRSYAFAPKRKKSFPVWTDDRNNLFQVLR